MINRSMRASSFVVVLAAGIVGCTSTMQPISGTEASMVHVAIVVGDTVRVLTKNGDRQTFKVTEITADTLDGEGQSIRYDEMAFVEKRVPDSKKEDKVAASVILTLLAGIVVGITLNDIDIPAPYGAP
jgi:hypothetical protein